MIITLSLALERSRNIIKELEDLIEDLNNTEKNIYVEGISPILEVCKYALSEFPGDKFEEFESLSEHQ